MAESTTSMPAHRWLTLTNTLPHQSGSALVPAAYAVVLNCFLVCSVCSEMPATLLIKHHAHPLRNIETHVLPYCKLLNFRAVSVLQETSWTAPPEVKAVLEKKPKVMSDRETGELMQRWSAA